MATNIDIVERTVLGAIETHHAGAPGKVTLDRDVLELVDSLGLVTAISGIQSSLGLMLEPAELVRIYGCRSVEDLVSAFRALLPHASPSRD